MYLSVGLRSHLTFVGLLLLLISTASQAKLSLKDALDAAIEKQKWQLASDEALDTEPADFVSWLDGAPFVSVSALRSNENLGTDEAEVGLTLPIKSNLRRSIEKKLKNNALVLKENANRQHALYLSGQIRELVWETEALNIKITAMENKIDMLSTLSEAVNALSESRALPEYIALLLKKESIDVALGLLEFEYQRESTRSEYTRLTGLGELPSNIQEKLIETSSFSISNHPDIALLDGAWLHYTSAFEAANKKAEPWQITLTARRVEVPAFTEGQIGIGVEIPLSIGSQYSELQHWEYVKAQTEYQLAKQTLGNNLRSNIERAKRNYDYLQARQTLLNSAEAPIQKLEQIIPTLLQANLENKETVIRRSLEIIDARASIQLNQVAVQKQISMLKQTAGITI